MDELKVGLGYFFGFMPRVNVNEESYQTLDNGSVTIPCKKDFAALAFR